MNQKPQTTINEKQGSPVIIVDDDQDMRGALANLFNSVEIDVALFGSAQEFLAAGLPATPSCIVLDIRLPGVSGLEFQAQLSKLGIELPIVFMTGHGDIPMSVRAMKAGAVDFLSKPFRDQDMLDAVASAIDRDRTRRASIRSNQALQDNYRSLTPREVEVMRCVTKGMLNKQVAGELGLAEVTVKIHRRNMMRKMSVRSLADLVRMAENLGIHGSEA